MGTEAETTVEQLQTRAPRTAGHRWKRGRAKGGFHLQFPGSVPADYLILVFWAPELQNNQLLLGHPACGCFFSSVQLSRSVVSDSLRPHESQHARPPCPSPTPGVHSDSTSIESVMPSCHLILCHPLLLLPPIPPSIRVFSNESTLRMRWPKYWSFSFCIIPSKEIPGLKKKKERKKSQG